ncbi:RES family NAD+ phosphorylase [Streptomyces sp. HPF1205]|uniref:RES family NAD+ phosphorylase n=1 Tax=Streptomyces sp. HPF1205 TaxID=2873262 RepID=UPI001CEC5DAB|nr:RES family NAD+ phosphorylase [Streptomyces sp. HPF1205]
MGRGQRLPEKTFRTPESVEWQPGTRLFRVHQRKYSATAFNPTLCDPHFGGSRFDATENDPYAYLYAAPRVETALAETVLRDLPFDVEGNPRVLPYKALAGRCVTELELLTAVRLLSLMDEPARVAVRQDAWLVHAEAPEYPFTRRWGHWIRSQAEWAQGLVWPSKRDGPWPALVLFADRLGCSWPGQDEGESREGGQPEPAPRSAVLRRLPKPSIDLDDQAGLHWLEQTLYRYDVHVGAPPS